MNKTITIIIGTLIVVFAAGASVLFFNQEYKLALLTKEGVQHEKEDPVLDKIKREMVPEIKKDCKDVQLELKKNEDIFSFPWLEQKDKIILISGYEITLDMIPKNRECVRKTMTDYLLKNGFIKSEENSDSDEYPLSWGFEKRNIKISLNTTHRNVILFGDAEEDLDLGELTMEEYSRIFLAMFPARGDQDYEFCSICRVYIKSLIGEFVLVDYTVFPGSDEAVLKKENNDWRYIVSSGQEHPSCAIVFDEKIPTAIIDTCYSLENNCLMQYNKEEDSWYCPDPDFLGFYLI